MIDLKSLIENESLADVACALAGSGGEQVFSYVSLDRLYSRYKFEVIQSFEFQNTLGVLIEKQILNMSSTMGLSRGINWKMPQCRKDKKYGFE
ncbi:hypothetical protein V8O11_00705 [Erwinia aphidicola]|uniref:hypothetical protein n=1 Tax=Erwinia TaxID=551 RepID=UPI0010607E4F|nr:hypothetical protein [Erwinia aphidicola]MCP2230004.1 hypothetical protein [Erwinia aphidicola]